MSVTKWQICKYQNFEQIAYPLIKDSTKKIKQKFKHLKIRKLIFLPGLINIKFFNKN